MSQGSMGPLRVSLVPGVLEAIRQEKDNRGLTVHDRRLPTIVAELAAEAVGTRGLNAGIGS